MINDYENMFDDIYGSDYDSKGNITSTGDIKLVNGHANAIQQIKNRLTTPIGFYLYLSDYGSQIHEIIGEKGDEAAYLLELYIKNCLKFEPRVDTIINIDNTYNEASINCIISLLLTDEESEEIGLKI